MGTWKDAQGGSVTFGESGTFTADKICGDSVVRTGSWWIFTPSPSVEPNAATQVKLDFAGESGKVREYTAGGSSNKVILWAAIGDLDDSNYCLLGKE
ncbi:hypothetical protein GCM10010251_83110 [Streptomyces aurantiogriseus]|uniref:Uncharacterized protein n=1 Tax=Streptomyces aurantiogriseus TaxID=66870 RepID=A0A918FM00_9ACTN|nr:hypothetical protein GCM10010251_83110 [Streptomyces aurantiogriseus]